MTKVDICIAGGGMVGSALAIGLAKFGLKVAVIEQHMPTEFSPDQSPDMRVSAISASSEALLSDLGAWQYIRQTRLCPYRRLSVWDRIDCRTDFDAADLQVTHLGHIIENRMVQLGLHQAMATHSNILCFANRKIMEVTFDQPTMTTLDDGQVISSTLIIGADGGNSLVRQKAGIGSQGWQYSQQALGIKIKTTEAQQDITWQQFSPSGPMAFLPLYDGYASLVWYAGAEKIQFLKGLNKSKLKEQIKMSFPKDLVDFDVLEMANFPLTRMHALQYVKQDVVLVGDAAHTINPLAGQGVNLGYKDVAMLLECIGSAVEKKRPVNDATALLEYQRKRKTDNLFMMSTMDLLYGVFSNDNPLLSTIRNVGLKMANKAGPLKHQAMKYAIGM